MYTQKDIEVTYPMYALYCKDIKGWATCAKKIDIVTWYEFLAWAKEKLVIPERVDSPAGCPYLRGIAAGDEGQEWCVLDDHVCILVSGNACDILAQLKAEDTCEST